MEKRVRSRRACVARKSETRRRIEAREQLANMRLDFDESFADSSDDDAGPLSEISNFSTPKKQVRRKYFDQRDSTDRKVSSRGTNAGSKDASPSSDHQLRSRSSARRQSKGSHLKRESFSNSPCRNLSSRRDNSQTPSKRRINSDIQSRHCSAPSTPSAINKTSALSEIQTPRSTRRKIALKLGMYKEEALTNCYGSDSEDQSNSDNSDSAKCDELEIDDTLQVEDGFNHRNKHLRHTCSTDKNAADVFAATLLSDEQINAILKNERDPYAKHKDCLLKELSRQFPFWLDLTLNGSNILLYGLGSKIKLINEFAEFLYGESYVTMVINGFLPTCTLQEILNEIIENVIEDCSRKATGLQAQVDTIRAYFSDPEAMHLYLLVNSIDAAPMTNPKILQAFETLASASQIHIVGVVNHINAPLLWDLNRVHAMRWVWIEAVTYENYTMELSSITSKSSSTNAFSSLEHVFASLTANAKQVFMIIANHILEAGTQSSYPGMAFQDCYRACREAFIVNSDLTLRAQLTEFVDHALLRICKGQDGVEYLSIPLPLELVSLFVQRQIEAAEM